MKSWKLFWMSVVVATIAATQLTACGKKGGDNSNSTCSGSVCSDGQNVTSRNSTVQGMPLDLTMQNISANMYGGGYGGGYGQQIPVTFTLSISGASQQLTAYSSWSNMGQVGNWYVWISGACADTACSTVVATVLVTPMNYGYNNYVEYRQIAVKKDLRSNKVLSTKEFSFNQNNINQAASAQQLMYQM